MFNTVCELLVFPNPIDGVFTWTVNAQVRNDEHGRYDVWDILAE